MTKNWLWALVAGVTMGTVFGACGDPGTETLACASDGECLEGEVCIVGTCVVTCESGADCPDSAKTCGDFARADGTTAKVCQCVTDELCNSDGLTGLVCQPFKLCTARCDEGFACPSGTTCNAEGKCDAAAVCTTNDDCETGETCNTETGACEATAACDPAATTIGANGGESTCSYGEACASDGSCVAVEQGTCTQASGAPAWSSADTGRPVITNVTAVGFATSNTMDECGDGGPKSHFTVEFYSPTPLFESGLIATYGQQINIRSSTNFVNPAFEVTMVPVGAKVGQFTVGICGRQTGTAAIYVELPGAPTQVSNTACVTW